MKFSYKRHELLFQRLCAALHASHDHAPVAEQVREDVFIEELQMDHRVEVKPSVRDLNLSPELCTTSWNSNTLPWSGNIEMCAYLSTFQVLKPSFVPKGFFYFVLSFALYMKESTSKTTM